MFLPADKFLAPAKAVGQKALLPALALSLLGLLSSQAALAAGNLDRLDKLLAADKVGDRYETCRIYLESPELGKNSQAMEIAGLDSIWEKRMSDALSILTKANSAKPNDPRLEADLGYALSVNGRAGQGITLLDKSLAKRPNSARTLALKAIALGMAGNETAADQCLKQAALDKNEILVLRARIDTNLRRFKQGQAMDAINEYLKAHPNDMKAFFWGAETKRHLGKLKESAADFEKLLKKVPRHSLALKLVSDIYRLHDQPAKAIPFLRTQLSMPLEIDNHIICERSLAECLERTGKYKEALKLRDHWLADTSKKEGIDLKGDPKKIKLNNFMAKNLVMRAKDYMQLKDYKSALADLNLILSSFPSMTGAVEDRAVTLTRLGKHKEALKDINSLISRNSEFPRWYDERAEIYEKLGDKKAAEADRKKSAALSKE